MKNYLFELRRSILQKFGTQLAFAQHMAVDESYLSKIIRGWRELDPERKNQWAKELEADEKLLFQRRPSALECCNLTNKIRAED